MPSRYSSGVNFPFVHLTAALALALAVGLPAAARASSAVATVHADFVDTMMPPLTSPRTSSLSVTHQDAIVAAAAPAAFVAFLDEVSNARYANVSHAAGLSESAFDDMRHYLRNRYDGVTVVRSFAEQGTFYDCIPTEQQPALRDGSGIAAPPASSPIATHASSTASTAASTCPAGSIPLERVGLDQLTRFPSLKAFFARNPTPEAHRQASRFATADAASTHHYASMFASMGGAEIAGAGADLNIWNPAFVTSNDYMSISQIWLDGASSSNQTQTLEVGWQRRPTYGTWGNQSILFVYSTQDGYVSTGCHNLECGEFVQVASGNVFGVSFAASRYSSTNGAQGVVKVAYQRNADGNWWLNVDGTWVGYYKAALYSGDLATTSTNTAFTAGGETYANGGGASTPMGSGVFAANGYRKAAFQANHFYIDSALASHAVTQLSSVVVSDPACYTIAFAGQRYGGVVPGASTIAPSPEMTTGEGFYFGGPGCH